MSQRWQPEDGLVAARMALSAGKIQCRRYFGGFASARDACPANPALRFKELKEICD